MARLPRGVSALRELGSGRPAGQRPRLVLPREPSLASCLFPFSLFSSRLRCLGLGRAPPAFRSRARGAGSPLCFPLASPGVGCVPGMEDGVGLWTRPLVPLGSSDCASALISREAAGGIYVHPCCGAAKGMQSCWCVRVERATLGYMPLSHCVAPKEGTIMVASLCRCLCCSLPPASAFICSKC